MALEYGTLTQLDGMSVAIYEEIKGLLSPAFGKDTESLEKAREGWKKLSFAIAKGVIDHIKENMEICGIQTKGNVETTVEGNKGTQTGVVFTQSNDGTGLVK